MTTSNTPSVEDLNTARKIFVAARRESLLSNKKEVSKNFNDFTL